MDCYADLSPATAIRDALKWQAVGFVVLIIHVVICKQSIGFLPITIALMGWLYANAPLAGLIVWFQTLIYQNWFIGLFSPGMDYATFQMLQGTNFAALALMGTIGFTRLMPSTDKLLWTILAGLVLAAIYTVYGATQAGLISSLIYFRSATTFILAAVVGLDVGRVWGYRTIALAFLASVFFSIMLSVIELVLTIPYYEITNSVSFYQLKTLMTPDVGKFHTAHDVLAMNTSDLFNFSGLDNDTNLLSYRFQGTVMHPISYAYILTATGLVALSIRRGYWTLLLIPLQLISGVKGAVLVTACTLVLWTIWATTRSRQFLLFASFTLIASYIGFGILYGLNAGDYHVIGFMGGVDSFLHNPLGHGIGVGGNLSTMAHSHDVKWQMFQHEGAANFALESAVGVLLYQMGIASVVIMAVFLLLLHDAPFGKRAPSGVLLPRRQDVLFLAMATVAVNGIFQEEAFSPYAAGLFTLLAATLVANGAREQVVLPSRAQRVRFAV